MTPPTIFAQSSGALPAAIAVFRLSGSRSLPVLREITRKQEWKPRQMMYSKIYSKDEKVIDKSMAVFLPGPSTFTGEDTAELFVHGSRAVAQALADRLSEMEGVRQALNGEFTKRAFYNGKMDVHEVRGLHTLLAAETQRQRELSFSQMRGGVEAKRIRDQLAEIVGRAFVLMDFGEHVDSSIEEVKLLIIPILAEVRRLERRARGAELVQKGLRVVLVGRPNSGKSSILNALVDRDVAIVSDTAGTTRDSIDVRFVVGGIPVTVTDTAGLRNTEDYIEMEGIKRAKIKIEEADIIVMIVDVRNAVEDSSLILKDIRACDTNAPLVLVRNKSDLSKNIKRIDFSQEVMDTVDTCALSQQGVTPLIEALERVVTSLCPHESGPCLTDHVLLSEAVEELESALSCSDAVILCEHLQSALDLFGQMVGSTANETILDQLFAKFCIGK